MTIEKRIKLNNKIYYISIETEYKKEESGIISLKLKNKDEYFDGGDLSLLIEKIEKEYQDSLPTYEQNISFLNDCLFIYDRIPILNKIRDVYIKENESLPYSLGSITKEELDSIIKENHIKMNPTNNFKLTDSRTW